MSEAKIYKREVDGILQDVESVTAFLGVYYDAAKEWIFATDWNGKKRAAFADMETARRWCRTANKVRAGIPQTNAEITRFTDAMKLRGWKVSHLLGDCAVWEGYAVIVNAKGPRS